MLGVPILPLSKIFYWILELFRQCVFFSSFYYYLPSVLTFLFLTRSNLFPANLEDVRADAYVVVFSIAHRDTFDVASDLLSNLRMDLGTDRSIILVGNKLDLVRKRKVKTEGR
jgi:GTPase SAR1 family protein